MFMGSVDSGASRVLHAALAPALPGPSGAYLERDRPKDPNPLATPALAADLWHHSETWTK